MPTRVLRHEHGRPTIDLHFRLAPRTAAEREAYDSSQPLHIFNDVELYDGDFSHADWSYTRGRHIEPVEWEQDWAEGERSANWLLRKNGG